MTKDGFTPLHEYASKGYVELGKLYLEHSNISVSAQSENGMTPLHCAASCGRSDFVAFLLECEGIDVNAVDRDGNTPLHYAARASSKATIEVLLSAPEIQANLENSFKETPFFLAAKFSNSDVFSAICSFGDVDINQKDSNGKTALIYSIERPCLSIFEFLLSCDTINVNIPDDEFGKTPLMHIITVPSCPDVQSMFETMLIVHGLNINAQDKSGNTVIHIAAHLDKKDILTRLLTVKGINMMISNGKQTVKEVIEMRTKSTRRSKKMSSYDFATDSSDADTEKIDRRKNMNATPSSSSKLAGSSKLVPTDELQPIEETPVKSQSQSTPQDDVVSQRSPDQPQGGCCIHINSESILKCDTTCCNYDYQQNNSCTCNHCFELLP